MAATSASILGQVEAFEPGSADWLLYTERLEQFFVANGIDDDKNKVAVFLTVIGAQAYALLRNLLAPTKPASTKYKELVVVMKDHLKPKPLVIAEIQVPPQEPDRGRICCPVSG